MSSKKKHSIEKLDESLGTSKKQKIEQNTNLGFYLTKLDIEDLTESSSKETKSLSNKMEISLLELFEGSIQHATLLTYLIELEWLLSEVPKIKDISKVLIIYDRENCPDLEKDIKLNKLNNFIIHGPRKPVPYGLHHSKALILVYETKIRIVVLTANLFTVDWGKKTQGVWFQDFPLKLNNNNNNNNNEVSEFESDLIDYLKVYKIGKTHETELLSYIKKFDFSMANVKLIPSVPGYHKNEEMNKYGHMKIRNILKNEKLNDEYKNSSIACQFSSLGSINEKWLHSEFIESLREGKISIQREYNKNDTCLIWPTVEDIRTSLEGWEAGPSFPGRHDNVYRQFLIPLYNKVDLGIINRDRAMPHIKTYTRFSNSGNLAWVILGSHNLSKAAWGTLQKNNSQLMIRSYELSVLFLPEIQTKYFKNEKCKLKIELGLEDELEMKLRPINIKEDKLEMDENNIYYPLPYRIPPSPYEENDKAWIYDECYTQKDILGNDFN